MRRLEGKFFRFNTNQPTGVENLIEYRVAPNEDYKRRSVVMGVEPGGEEIPTIFYVEVDGKRVWEEK